jgi:hypothetical protein
VPGAGDVEGVEVPGLDHPVQVGVQEIETRRRSPVPEQAGLDVFGQERFTQQRIVQQIDLSDRQVVGRPPVPIDQSQILGGVGDA